MDSREGGLKREHDATAALCRKCSLPLEDGARACARCGTEVSAAVRAEQETVASSPQSQSQTPSQSSQPGVFERGARIGDRYEIEDKLGAGGMGEVYRALDLELGRAIAIKIIRHGLGNSDVAYQRFKR